MPYVDSMAPDVGRDAQTDLEQHCLHMLYYLAELCLNYEKRSHIMFYLSKLVIGHDMVYNIN